MKKLLFLLLFLPFLGNSQATFTAPVGYNTGAPTATPSGVGTRWRFDLLTGKKYTWLPGTLSWDEDARGIDQVAGCSAPLYTPGYNQSTFAVNSCTVPELYQWTGVAWVRLNEGEVYTAGTGISIDGSNVIRNTAPNVVQTLSIAGQDLTLSGGGGTVAIPGGASDALGTGFTSGGGSDTIPDGTVATRGDSYLSFSGNEIAIHAPDISDPGADTYIRVAPNYLELNSVNSANQYFRLLGSPTTTSFTARNASMVFEASKPAAIMSFVAGPGTLLFDNATEKVSFEDSRDEGFRFGVEYTAYYPDIETNPQSFTDVQTVNSLKQKLATYTESERDAISSPATGYILFCTDAIADDSSTGVMQVYNGSVWKNAW